MTSILEEPQVVAAKSQIVNEARGAVAASQRARDEGFINLQMSEFCYRHPDVSDCIATRKILDEELRKFAAETLGPGQFYRFTAVNLETLVKEKPEVLGRLAPRPVTTPTTQAETQLRKQLIAALEAAGVSQQYLEPNKESGLRWVDTHGIAELQQLLANIENERKWRLMDRNTLKQEARGREQQSYSYEALPSSYELVRKDLWGHETKTVYELDGKGLRKLLYAMTSDEQKKFEARFGREAINTRLMGGII